MDLVPLCATLLAAARGELHRQGPAILGTNRDAFDLREHFV